MKSLETTKTITMMALFTAVLAYGGTAQGAGENLRCEARVLQIEVKILRGVVSCRERAERRRSFNEERCLTKCQSNYDEAFSQLLCAANRRLVHEWVGVDSSQLRREARLLQQQARELRCIARCDYSQEPEICVAEYEIAYGYVFDATTGQLEEPSFDAPERPDCTLSADGTTLECR